MNVRTLVKKLVTAGVDENGTIENAQPLTYCHIHEMRLVYVFMYVPVYKYYISCLQLVHSGTCSEGPT